MLPLSLYVSNINKELTKDNTVLLWAAHSFKQLYKITIKILCERMEVSLTCNKSIQFPGQEVKCSKRQLGFCFWKGFPCS